MINNTLFINGRWYEQTYKVHINSSYDIKTAYVFLGGEMNA